MHYDWGQLCDFKLYPFNQLKTAFGTPTRNKKYYKNQMIYMETLASLSYRA